MNYPRPWSRLGPRTLPRTKRQTVATVVALVLGVVAALAGIGVVRSQASAPSAVQYAGRTTTAHARASRSVTLEKPAGTAAGDVLVASFTAAGTATIGSAPTGWTSLLPRRLRAGTSASLFAYVRVVTAADARTSSWTWTLRKRRSWSGGVARYEGVDRSHPVDTTVSVARSRSPRSRLAVPGVTTTTTGTMLVGGVGAPAGKSTLTPPTGWTESWEIARGPASEQAFRLQDAAGKTAEWMWKVTSASPLAGWVTALRPAGASQTPTPSTPPATTPTATAPTASFTASPSQGSAPLSVAFTDTSTGAPTGWAWDFGDGTTGTAQSPVHTYVAAGTYTVSLRVTNASGSHTATRPGVVTVGPPLPAVLVGAGDIATCDYTEDSATAALVSATPGTVFALGDNAYPDGTANDYANCYQPTWGAVKDRTRPVVGNHEYLTSSTAAPYFAYYGGAAGEPGKGWYSYDIGTDWHVVVLNSNCTIVGCAAGSPQEQWLRADLAADTRPCTVAMWHHPRFSSGEHGNDSSTDAFWQALYADGAELVLNGHDHDYERFAPQNPSAVADPTYGLREFVVGTGGKDFRSFSSTPDVNSQLRSIAAHGVLKLTLNSGSYDWSFLAVPGTTLDDTGSAACHGAPAARVGPSAE